MISYALLTHDLSRHRYVEQFDTLIAGAALAELSMLYLLLLQAVCCQHSHVQLCTCFVVCLPAACP